MIQRIQTVYMLASVISILMMLVMPLGTVSANDAYFNVTALGITSVTPGVPLDKMSYGLVTLLLLMLALPLVCIFLYKWRKVQLRILIYTAVLDVLFYGYFFLYEAPAMSSSAMQVLANVGFPTDVTADYTFTLYAMPLVSLFCCVMAWRGVAYDIALLSAADRLRPSHRK